MIKLFEKFSNIDEVKEVIFNYAVETYDIEIINFFLNKGYDIDTDDALYKASYDDNILKFMIKKGASIENLSYSRLNDLSVQKILIDCGYERYIYETVGFHNSLKYDQKYSDIIQRVEDMKKYNL